MEGNGANFYTSASVEPQLHPVRFGRKKAFKANSLSAGEHILIDATLWVKKPTTLVMASFQTRFQSGYFYLINTGKF